jgi:pimeloyl-ACP methyl ester carboxylesterase
VTWFCDADLEPLVRQLRCPVLVLTGELDRMVSRASSDPLACGGEGSCAVVLPRSGHLAVVTEPERVGAAVADFLRGVRA